MDYSETEPAIHGGKVYAMASHWGVSPEQVFDFSANINPMGPPYAVMQALPRELAGIQAYPDSTEFITTLSVQLGVSPKTIIVGNGSTALIDEMRERISHRA